VQVVAFEMIDLPERLPERELLRRRSPFPPNPLLRQTPVQLPRRKHPLDLATFRDWLLPMLMNGQVTVAD
jgi:hypothetical protein